MDKMFNYLYKKVFLVKVKSKYILKKIFDNLQKRKKLELIRYNKYFQNKLNKSLEDYKKEHCIIEIEIIPRQNKSCKIINIPKKYDSYYHIYLNDNDNESETKIKRINKNLTRI